MPSRNSDLHPELAAVLDELLAWARYYAIPVTVTSKSRSWAEQARLRQEWEAGRNKWPANRPGDSAHNYGAAFDSSVPAQYRPVWKQAREYVGLRVPPNDEIHAEVPRWRELASAGVLRPVGL